VQRSENGSDMSGSGSYKDSKSKRIINLLEPIKLNVWKGVIERIKAVQFRMDSGGIHGTGCFEIRRSALRDAAS